MPSASTDDSATAARTIVLLGASNLTLGWSSVVDALADRFPGPQDIFVAAGMGRSYLKWSRFLARRLPGICDCGLWQAVGEQQQPVARPAAVLITDIGNDLIYGFPVPEIIAAVHECIGRVRGLCPGGRILLTGLPVEPVSRLSPLRYHLFRRALFPGLDLPLSVIQEQCRELQSSLQELADEQGIPLFRPDPGWYGFDPVHIRRGHRQGAFREIFRCWDDPDGPQLAQQMRNSRGRRGRFRSCRRPRAAVRTLWGRTRYTEQPWFSTEGLRIFAY